MIAKTRQRRNQITFIGILSASSPHHTALISGRKEIYTYDNLLQERLGPVFKNIRDQLITNFLSLAQIIRGILIQFTSLVMGRRIARAWAKWTPLHKHFVNVNAV